MVAPEAGPGAGFPPEIPRTLWVMWLQGEDGAPWVVRQCLASWRRHNPEWEIRFLTEATYRDYVDPELFRGRTPTPQCLADLVRLHLLARHGGVWADATLYCCKPLLEWLPEYSASGFFAFSEPGRGRALSNWFLVSSRENHLTRTWADACREYQQNNRLTMVNVRRDRSPLDRLLMNELKRRLNRSRESTRGWFSPFVRKVLRVHPYFWSHYLFDRVLERDPEARAIWERTPRFPADLPHRLQLEGLLSPLTPALQEFIDRRESPVLKLTWRYEAEQYRAGTVLHYLLEGSG